MQFQHPPLFELLGLPVTGTVVTTWFMVAALSIVAVLAGKSVRLQPSRWQAMIEWGIGGVSDMLGEMAGPTAVKYVPLIATIGLFVLVANLLSVLPFVEAPTADINTPIALALIVLFSVHVVSLQTFGPWGYLKSFAQPSPVLIPFNILGQITRTFSLAIRLFGNMLSHQIIVAVLLLILPLFVPAMLQVFGLLIGVLQAYIFTILSTVYIGGAIRAEGSL
jgi:F-type H+-transporting ATPase subunit a